MVVVGNLTGQKLLLNSGDILFNDKSVVGFYLSKWISVVGPEEAQRAFKAVSDDLRDGGKIFGTQIAREFQLSQFKEALVEGPKIATEGKILIKC